MVHPLFYIRSHQLLLEFSGNMGCSVLNKLTLLTYQYETKQEEG